MDHEAGRSKWYFSRWGVAVLLVCLGPLAFPFLWKSNRFGAFWKWVLTIGVTASVVVLTWGSWMSVAFLLDRLREAGLL